MSLFIVVLRFVTMLWMFWIPLGFWMGARRAAPAGKRLLAGLGWAWGMWLLTAAAWVVLLWVDEQPGGWLTDPAVRYASLVTGVMLGGVWAIRQAVLILHQRRMQNAGEALDWLKEMPSADFEALIGRYFKSTGCVVRHVGKSGDHGVDLAIYTPREGKWIAQCKRYKNRTVGEGAVRDLYGAMMHEHADRAFIFTTSIFSQPALDWAAEKPIELVGGEELVALLNSHNVRYMQKGIAIPPATPPQDPSL
ncbi:MAG: restriction endonuclease [Anaerolineaceae bacterium]